MVFMSKPNLDVEEILHIVVSVVTISLAFSLFKEPIFSPDVFFTVLLTVGLGFVLHELAHKYVAIHYGAHAYYRAFVWGLALSLILAFSTQGQFVFAAPGAVFIHGNVTREQNGKISLAGPMTNLVLALGFVALGMGVPALHNLATTGAYVNAFLGAFNMIPFAILDGAKIWAWSKGVWAATFGAFVVLFFLAA